MRRDETRQDVIIIISVKQNKTASSDSTAEFKDVKVVKRFNVREGFYIPHVTRVSSHDFILFELLIITVCVCVCQICQVISEVSSANQELLRKYKREMNLRKKCHNELVRLKGERHTDDITHQL